MFNAFPAAAESDATLIGDSVRTARPVPVGDPVAGGEDRPCRLVSSTTVIDLLRACLSRTLDDVSMLHTVAPDAFPQPVILDAYTDVVHRTLFGLNPA